MKSYSSSKLYANRSDTEAIKDAFAGVLDGITIFRFAHMRKNTNSGGVEAYLSNLNHRMLQRHRMRILQMYLVSGDKPCNIEIEKIGRGELVWIPSRRRKNTGRQMSKILRLWPRLIQRPAHQYVICHDMLLSCLSNYQPNIAVFHWISEDSPTVLDYLNKRSVPFVVVNHFQNKRLARRKIKKQIAGANAIGGVSNIGVPGFIRSRFTNLSDGVDTNFFHPEKAGSPDSKINDPLILLPARITEWKGHIDAVRALGWLLRAGVDAVIAFAGIQASPAYIEKLRRIISEEGVQERVIFAGELSPKELRNWYAASILIVLPSYSEGLGKVLLEAQAMERPVVAYDVGGVPDALRHSETGYLVKKGDIKGLASRLKQLIEEPDMRRAMGERGRKFVVERFSMESLTIRHEEFYAETLNK